MHFKLQDYHEGFFHPSHIKIFSVILFFWTEIFHNAHLILCILFEKFGGDPMKRTVNNQLQVQICYAFLLNNIFYTPVYIWRIFIGSIHPLFASVASYIYQIYLSWILLAFTEMSVITTFTLLKVSKSQKQFIVQNRSSIFPKKEQRISALAYKEKSNQKNKGTLLY